MPKTYGLSSGERSKNGKPVVFEEQPPKGLGMGFVPGSEGELERKKALRSAAPGKGFE
jgi:hypothetical protein